jgi:NAD(P)H-quinone oxidoreductase subunit I
MGIKLEALKNLFKKPSTTEYPFKKTEPHERFRGRITFDKSKCIGCALCRMYCPANCIKLTWKKEKFMVKGIEHQKIVHPIHEIDFSKCIRCGNCVDICPVDCIWFTQDFELADSDKNKLISKTNE